MPLTEIRKLPPSDFRRYQRHYVRQPFGSVRLDLMAWMVARNVGEMFGGRLRSPDRAVWGHKRRVRRRRDVKPQTDAETLSQFAKALGIPQTKAEG